MIHFASKKPSKSHLGGVLSRLGRISKCFGGVLDTSRGILGASWGVSGPSRRRLGPSWRRLGPSWRHHVACWERLGGVLEALGGLLGRLGGVLEAFYHFLSNFHGFMLRAVPGSDTGCGPGNRQLSRRRKTYCRKTTDLFRPPYNERRHAAGRLRARCGSTAQQSCEPATELTCSLGIGATGPLSGGW